MKRRSSLLAIILVTSAALTLSAAASSACPMCKDSVANTDGNVAAGFNNSIYFMLLGFFGCLALVTRTIIKGVRSSTVPPGFPVRGNPPRPPQDPEPGAPTDPNDHLAGGPGGPGSQS